MKHTKEPWAAYQDGKREMNNINHFIKSEAGDLVSYGHLYESDAKRIVACVNACAGISNEILEKFEQLKPAVEHCKKLEEQRDELLAAMRKIAGMPCVSLRARKMSKVACDAVRSVTGGGT